jgi:hypothetical protein
MVKKSISLEDTFLRVGQFIDHELQALFQRVKEVEVLEDMRNLRLLSEVWSCTALLSQESDVCISLVRISETLKSLETEFHFISNKFAQVFNPVVHPHSLDMKVQISESSFRALAICLFESAYSFAGNRGVLRLATDLSKESFTLFFFGEQFHPSKKSVLSSQLENFEDESRLHPSLLLFRKCLLMLVKSKKVEFSEEIKDGLYTVKIAIPIMQE